MLFISSVYLINVVIWCLMISTGVLYIKYEQVLNREPEEETFK